MTDLILPGAPEPLATPAPATTDWVPMWALQQGVDLSGYQLRSEKDQASGYAGLDANKVLRTGGDTYAQSGTAYQTRIGNSSGLPSVAFGNPPDTYMYRAAPAVVRIDAVAVSSYGTSFPTTPVDGQEFTLTDSVSAPTYCWRFRWNVTLSSWEFIGGRPRSVVGGNVNRVISTGTDVGSSYFMAPELSWVAPRQGNYWVTACVQILNAPGQGGDCGLNIAVAGAVVPGITFYGFTVTTSGQGTTIPFHQVVSNVAAGATFGICATTPNSTTFKFANCTMSVVPSRLT